MSGAPDPKPLGGRPRERDPFAVRIATAARPECVACGEPGANGHHVLERDDGGDDDPRNAVTLCGSGTMRCHGALHGNPYTVHVYDWNGDPLDSSRIERRDRRWVARRIGDHLLAYRPDTIVYLVERLGEREALRYLETRYEVDLRDPRLRIAIPPFGPIRSAT